MTIHLYFSLIPEALIASMLPPEQFGQYYATGHKYKSKGQAIFFEVDPSFRHEFFSHRRRNQALRAPSGWHSQKLGLYLGVPGTGAYSGQRAWASCT